MHEYLLHDLARARLDEHRRAARDHHAIHHAIHAARRPRSERGRPGLVARILAHLRLRPVEPPRRPEPAGT